VEFHERPFPKAESSFPLCFALLADINNTALNECGGCSIFPIWLWRSVLCLLVSQSFLKAKELQTTNNDEIKSLGTGLEVRAGRAAVCAGSVGGRVKEGAEEEKEEWMSQS